MLYRPRPIYHELQHPNTAGATAVFEEAYLFAKDTYTARLEAMQSRLNREGIDVAVITTAESITYLAGVEVGVADMPQYLILTRDGKHAYVIRGMEISWQTQWAENTWCDNWVGVEDHENYATRVSDQLKELLGSTSSPVLACEVNRTSVTYEEVQLWANALNARSVVSVAELVEDLRMIKSPEEIQLMRNVAKITAVGMDAAVAAIAAGGTELDAQRETAVAMEKAGSGQIPIGPWASSGPDAALGHLSARRIAPQPGDFTTFMITATLDRYVAPLERTFAIGKLTDENQKLLQIVRSGQELALEKIKPGMTSHEADEVVRNFYEEAGVGRFFTSRLGYSIGMSFPGMWWENDIMQMRAHDNRVLKPGMTFHVVPALHIPGVGFATSTMPIEVTDTGIEPLTDYPIDVPPIEVG